ncbi:MAG: hypothetical protein U0Q18_00385 [Bryobacteraceae bacterium]
MSPCFGHKSGGPRAGVLLSVWWRQQFRTTTAHAGSGAWRCLAVEKLDEVELLEEEWRTEARAPQRCVDRVDASVDQPDELQKGQ